MATGTIATDDITGRPIALRSLDLTTFFRPRRVAVVGASDTNARPNTALTQKITVWAEERGATVYFVNPNRPEVAGRPCAKALTDIADELDLVAILVGDPLPILRDAVAAKAKFAVVFAAGFAEVGPEGERLQDEMEAVIAGGDLHVLGPNTNLNAFEVFRDDLPGRAIALITQSGHQGRPIFQGQEIGIKLSHWAPAGNEADLESADFINYFSGLESTGAVACYIEGFKDGRTLQLAADAAARRRVPIVAVKVGRTDEGTSMAKAHTGHLTGSDDVVSAVFRQYGAQRVDGLDQLLEVSAALARTTAPSPAALERLATGAGGRVCVYSISGGTGAHMADMVSAAGLDLPELAEATQTQLHQWIPPYLRVSNPVDNGGAPVRDERGPKIIAAMLADPNVDLLLCPITGALPSMGNKLTQDLVDAAAGTDKPVFVVWGSPVGTEEAYTKTLLESSVPTFRTFTNAVMAAKAYFDHHGFVSTYVSGFDHPALRPSPARKKALPLLRPGGDRRGGGATRGSGKSERGGTTLSEQDSKALLQAYGIAVPKERVATSASEAAKAAKKIGYPVVMKIVSADIPHKSDLGLVAVGVRDEDEARRTYKRLVAAAKRAAPTARVDGVLVAEMVDGVETVVGIAQDELFGPVVMFGLGGVLVEVLRDVTFRVPPFTEHDAAAMLGEVRGGALLDGVRGAPAADRQALVDVLMKMQRLAVDLSGSVAEVDVNPLLAGPSGAIAADALVVLA
ncbi:MAG TPA: acetate--CoA ligase family protein [Acidimicrobiales bacterium]|jgi:acyl-CoA synthetase (NDP forming)|nr:acetate--CoA ligase family protein [Acidimicrobiales bacterium]